MIDENVCVEEAQGINGKTPAKHPAPSPKPQGMLIFFFFKSGQVLWSLMKPMQNNDQLRVLSYKWEELGIFIFSGRKNL